jgi:hypothetical protein
MVGEEVFHFHDFGGGVFAGGDAGRPCEVVFRDRTICQFVMSADEGSGACAKVCGHH